MTLIHLTPEFNYCFIVALGILTMGIGFCAAQFINFVSDITEASVWWLSSFVAYIVLWYIVSDAQIIIGLTAVYAASAIFIYYQWAEEINKAVLSSPI